MTSSSLTSPIPLRQDAMVMALVGLAHSISHFCHLLLAPLFPVFMREFDLSFAQMGSLVSLFFVISSVGQALSGFVVDRFGARPVLFAALGSFVVAVLAASQASGYMGLAMAAVFAGLGNSPFHPVDFTILNQRVSAPRLGYAFSVHGLSGNLGWALAPVWLVGLMTAFDSWRMAYLASAALIVLVMATLWWHRELIATTVVRKDGHGVGESSTAFLKLPVVWWCFGFFFFSTMTLAVVQSFGAPILQAVHHINFETATGAVSAYMLASALGMLVGGFVAAKFHSSDRVVAMCLLAGFVVMALCSTGWLGAWGTMGLLVSTGLAIGVGGPSRDMMIKKATPKGATGRVYGTVYSGLDAGFALAPLMFGWLMDGRHYGVTLFGAALMLLIGVFMATGVGARTAPR